MSDKAPKKPEYPAWVCAPCGKRYGRGLRTAGHISTWHPGTCGVCRKEAEVTEPRDFGHLVGWENR